MYVNLPFLAAPQPSDAEGSDGDKAADITPSYEIMDEEQTASVYMDVSGGEPEVTNHTWNFNHNGTSYSLSAGDSQDVFTALDPIVSH